MSRAMSSTATRQQHCVIAVAQMCSTHDVQANLDVVQELVHHAVQQHAQMIFFPEACDFIGRSVAETLELSQKHGNGDLMQRYCALARERNVWLAMGGVHLTDGDAEAGRVWNANVLIDPTGDVCARYDKLHLFDVHIPDKNIRIKESDFSKHGRRLIEPTETPAGRIGLATCYDVRFPELSLWLRERGADLLTYPSAFTEPTGEAHWHCLLRARAIETQCFVVAAAQVGAHNERRRSFGHSMIVDPWGHVIVDCGTETPIVKTTRIDLANIQDVRARLPCFSHRRPDLLSLVARHGHAHQPDINRPPLNFGRIEIPADTVFFETEHSFAFVNLKPLLDGHVLVATRRTSAARLGDLSLSELSDLWACVQRVQRMIEQHCQTHSSNISVQDGPDAGQTVNQVHVHILPRKPGDFPENDDVYRELEKHDREALRTARSHDAMAAEARLYRMLFRQHHF